MVTHYADLIEAAHDNLDTAAVRTRHPAAGAHPAAISPAHLADLADALAHLGATIGDTGRPARDLHTALRALARVDLDPTGHDHTDPRGPALDLAEATIAVRVAADLIASHGPTPDQLTARHLANEWADPRPEHLTALTARQGVWAQIADLATLALPLTGPAPDPLLDQAAHRVAAAAAAIPRHDPAPAVQATGPAWPLPLPRHPVPDEWAGRLEELTALAWRMTLPPDPGRAHPITGLRLIAETGHQLHNQAAKAATDPADRRALLTRAELWRTIHRQLHALHTPTEPLMPAQAFALLRTRALAVTPLDPGDLLAGRTALTQAASWAPTTLRHYLDNSVVGLGPTLTPQLRDHLTGFHRPAGWNGLETHPHEAVLLASLNRRPASPIPPGALDPVIALYQAAAHHLTPAPTPPPGPARRLAAVPTPVAAAPVAGHPTIRKGPRL